MKERIKETNKEEIIRQKSRSPPKEAKARKAIVPKVPIKIKSHLSMSTAP
jgi:hypothetical protein